MARPQSKHGRDGAEDEDILRDKWEGKMVRDERRLYVLGKSQRIAD
jgi:hypothetical protein